MRSIVWISIVVSLIGCHKHEERSGSSSTDQLRAQFSVKMDELRRTSDEAFGWPSVSDCDGLMWAGLALAAGSQVNLAAAELAPGEMHRRPAPCWTKEGGDVGSKSTISQDMLIGYLWGLWRSHDLSALQRLAAYGEAHEVRLGKALVGWVMGQPYPLEAARVFSRLNVVGAVGRMLYGLSGGTDDRTYRKEPTVFGPVAADFEQHLQVLSILLEGELTGEEAKAGLLAINDSMLSRLNDLAASNFDDALFQTALGIYTGDYARAIELLTADTYVLPTYVRGADAYGLVHWLFAAHLVLKHHPDNH